MRIVIDLQGAQTENRFHGIGHYCLSLTKNMVLNRGDHEIVIVLNGLFEYTIEPIRTEFYDLLPQDNICVWYAPGPVSDNEPDNRWRRQAAELIREAFIANLKPDIILVTNLFSGLDDNAITSIGALASNIPTAVIVYDSNSITNYDAHSDNSVIEAWYKRKFDHLHRADIVFSGTALSHKKDIQNLYLPENIAINITVEADSENIASTQIIAALEKSHIKNLQRASNKPSLTHKPKMAYISPLPPERSGISDYSAELLPELSQYYDIDVIVAQESVSDPWINANCNIQNVEWFRSHANYYERVIYHFGNSPFHSHMFSLLEEIPGVVMLHDFFLSDVIRYIAFKCATPNFLSSELYRSHGYFSVQEHFHATTFGDTSWKYPCNYSVLKNATGIIVHSEHSRKLAKRWYNSSDADDWVVIPLLRKPIGKCDRTTARDILKFNSNDFVVCSFGGLGPTKLNHRLLESWLNSSLAEDKNCVLVFVGEDQKNQYSLELIDTIRHSGLSKRIRITGWADAEVFHNYLAAADVGVQLRTLSRGETSAAVLDCMNYGLPTIVNSNGSMADLPGDAVWKLPDEFKNHQLIDSLETLWKDQLRRQQLGRRSRETILTTHKPDNCATQYFEAIEHFNTQNKTGIKSLVQAVANLDEKQNKRFKYAELAQSIARNSSTQQLTKQLLIDISATCRNDLKTGIERVTHAILIQLIKNPPKGYRVEPVYLSDEGHRWHYRYARNYTCQLLDLPKEIMHDDIVEYYAGDTLFSSDYSGDMLIAADQFGLYKTIRNSSVKVFFMVHDLLPVSMNQHFPPNASENFASWLHSIYRISDGIVCVTKSVAKDMAYWISEQKENKKKNIKIYWSHHGADIPASTATNIKTNKRENKKLAFIKSRPTFLMVGTIEPRKGHIQTLDAFDIIWREEGNINLVIVGKEGWKDLAQNQRCNIPEIISKINNHPEFNKRLFYLEGISDNFLEKIYKDSTCLIAASEGEGFGLPLIEAAQKALPIIARDIPVFREVAQDHAYYFSGQSPEDIASTVQCWLNIYKDNKHPKSSEMPWLTWSKSASQLSEIICHAKVNLTNQHSAGILNVLHTKHSNRCYVDISILFGDDSKTGVQRVTRSVLRALLQDPPQNFEVIPVYISNIDGPWIYKIAASYIAEHMPEIDITGKIEDDYIDIGANDIFLGLDLAGEHIVVAAKQNLYKQFKNEGVKVYFVVYDLLPVTMPEYFSEKDSWGHNNWLNATTQGDGVLCISEATANEYRQWLSNNPGWSQPGFSVQSFHLGADIENSLPSCSFSCNADSVIDKIERKVSFLQVGTLEPRKGCSQTLAAFEELWKENYNVNLVFIGKQGWMSEALVERLREHPQLNEKLFWLDGISDEYLESVYGSANCLITASQGEGFGLPLIEAALHKLPIIARDIPVFREVAGEHAYYFSGDKPEDISLSVRSWLNDFYNGKVRSSHLIKWLTWKESTKQLLSRLIV